MLVALLLLLHVFMLAALYRTLERRVGRIVALAFFVYMGAFTVLKPALMYYIDVYYPYSTNADGAIIAMLCGSLLFLVTLYLTIRLLGKYFPGRRLTQWVDFNPAKPIGIWLTFGLLMVISFVGSAIRFGNLGYLWSSASIFDAATSQASGSYYINYLAECLFYGAVMVIAYYSTRLSPAKSFALFIVVVTLTYLWSRLAARTGVLVMLLAWACCSFSIARQRSVGILRIGMFGYVLLILLYVGNFVRLGNVGDINVSTAVFGAAMAAASDMGPVDDAALLYAEMHNHEGTHFLQLAGALTPMVLIPSSIFPLKIPADKDSELNRIFFPEGADTSFYHEGSILTFTVPASGYADAGYLGVFVSSFVYAILFCVCLGIYRKGSSSARFIAIVLLLVHIVGYRLSVEALLMSFYATFLFIIGARWLAIAASRLKVFAAPPVAPDIQAASR
jgi:hypothetical protein